MQDSIQELEQIISDYAPLLGQAREEDLVYKPIPHKWSKKEILGHLVDSAQNNIRRFICAQYEDQPRIVYNQDRWVIAANYQQYPSKDLISLWTLLNRHMCMVLKNIPPGLEKRDCMTSEIHSIEWLAADYNKHLLHHLHQVLNFEPVAYP